MTLAIWKYPLDLTALQTIEMQEGAEIIYVREQHGRPTLWALVDPYATQESRTFGILPTGASFDESEVRYLGTVFQHEGALVWHVVEPLRRTERTVKP
jgi:hypothetical protein